ncbi:hypothetical protein [Rhodophyticola porphyridii]|uniref:hypothetical protein n=1 Tax=Rhodophyticola porphyridii TaxID=1852017 RepID=UPI0035CFFE2E
MALADNSLVHMGVGFGLMGAWAAYANAAHPMPAPLIAGLLQGCLTAAITLVMKRMLEMLCRQLPGLAGLILPPVAAFALSLTLLGAIHTAAGTPEVLATLAVPTTVATLYATLYTYRLWSRRP